ncbi:MAG: SusC/RagA family TonB-linked outer membrane protein [Flavobacteriaceae bacterium]|nr:SusC/RagA family TonB-linked outer membrane protein [Flavobacteriaceae bacterium]MBT3793889.1 SusC/RagA family TonB-linked outer membrane protein [Flavobacteriaceae bacterium]MBT4415148.1 SusC/RagA family TonB-linked outer membrane protein [Flavobacteriaceae bacterium]MBT5395910.1 SusC/RagA family TonB-linked outer membrane protein [Flavobacteriaceae bacterium]MBT6688999.1 SusC/RagA family TonB-linked outer membrane protein [Flavobacteriaceae bacterium]
MKKLNFLNILIVFVFGIGSLFSQKTITGNVTADGVPLPGVSVIEQGTVNGVNSDFDGNYTITLINENSSLIFSFIGFVTQTVSTSSANIDIAMVEDIAKLEEVVVTGYGSTTKKTLTGAIGTVSSEALTLRPTQNTTELLMGQVAGLSTRQVGSLPGNDWANLSIRNFGSPIVLIDGVESTLGQIDPNDIQSISVLKDAAATIYGARAGNGVILVTTKRGSDAAEGAKFNYHGTTTWSALITMPNTVNAHQFAELMEENGLGAENEMPEYLDYDTTRKRVYNRITGEDFDGVDWYRTIYKDWTPQKQHNLSARGRSDKIGYFISLGFTDTQSAFRDADYTHNRYNIRSNLDAEFNDNLSARLDISYRQTTLDRANFGISEMYNRLATGKPTNLPIFPNPDFASQTGAATPYSPVYMTRKSHSGTRVDRDNNLQASISLKYDVPFIDGLSATASLNMETQTEWNKKVQKKFNMYTYNPLLGEGDAAYVFFGTYQRDMITVDSDRDMELLPKITLNYENSWDEHDLKATFVAESTTFERDYLMGSRTDPLSFEAPYLNYSSEAERNNAEIFSQSARSSYVGRVNYDYKQKYLFEATMRADATARYAVEGRWGYFPSISFGWRISQEDFMKDSPTWNNLKLRASYGLMGNDAVSNFDYLTGYNISSGFYMFDGKPFPIISSAGLANRLVTWETMKIANIGIEGTLWNGGLGFELDVFYRLREDILALPDSDIPFHFGASLPKTNLNSRDNRGFDLMLKHKGKIGNVSYNINPMVSFSRGKYVSWEENILPTDGADGAANATYNNRYVLTGNWDDRQWGYQTNGFFTSQSQIDNHPVDIDGAGNVTLIVGNLIKIDQNGDGLIDWRDQVVIGQGGMPKWNYSTNMGAKYKNWSLDMLWQGATGYTITFGGAAGPWSHSGHQSVSKSFAYENRSLRGANGDIEILRAFPPTFTTGGMPQIDQPASDFNKVDAMYLRLKTISLSYNIPKNIVDKIGLTSIQLYLAGSNLLTIDNLGVYSGSYDPEIVTGTAGGNIDRAYPNNKTLTTGIKIGF